MKITESEALSQKISSLQNKRQEDLKLLKEQIHQVHESIKPINLIKNAFHEMTSSSETKSNLVDSAIGLTSGFLSKKILFGSSKNPIRNILGNVLQYAVSNIVSKHTDEIKSKGADLLLKFFNRNKENQQVVVNKA
jgi:hypothetical protein